MLPQTGDARRIWSVVVAAASLAVVLGTLAIFIARAQAESRSHLMANFKLRGQASATFVSAYVAQQAARERASAEQLMAVPHVTRSRFRTVATAFGAQGAVLLDSTGHVLDVTPSNAGHVGQSLTAYRGTRATEQGSNAVSDVLPGPNGLPSIVTIAVPFQSVLVGQRVFAAAYRVDGAQLSAFVDHQIPYSPHEVLLIDSHGTLLAGSPRTGASSIYKADLPLAEAIARHSIGSVPGEREPSTFTVAPIAGTPWRMVLMVPNSKLLASISGAANLVPWVVFSLVSVLGVMLVLLFGRSLADRARLSQLSSELESIARTDVLTGLLNRRGIELDLARAFARSHRRTEAMTVLMIDLDRFKEVNDRHGHEAGDRVLLAVADCMRDTLRGEDVYGRLGGDEFVVVMSGTDEEAGRAAAQRLEAAAAAVDLSDLGLAHGVPMSIGLACGTHAAPEDLMRAADAELYRVKGARRAAAPAPTERAGVRGAAVT
jgi:diguanylate cyclase (GGDEF)-like protein